LNFVLAPDGDSALAAGETTLESENARKWGAGARQALETGLPVFFLGKHTKTGKNIPN
jgi:hypothetical protein